MDRGDWRATVYGITESDTTEVTEQACVPRNTHTGSLQKQQRVVAKHIIHAYYAVHFVLQDGGYNGFQPFSPVRIQENPAATKLYSGQ